MPLLILTAMPFFSQIYCIKKPQFETEEKEIGQVVMKICEVLLTDVVVDPAVQDKLMRVAPKTPIAKGIPKIS